MKRSLQIVAGMILVIALAFGIEFWKEAQAINREAEHLLDLQRILALAENRGADWATDELLINQVDSLRKKSLYKKWGEPSGRTESANQDIWVLSHQFRLIVDYDKDERIESVKVVSGT